MLGVLELTKKLELWISDEESSIEEDMIELDLVTLEEMSMLEAPEVLGDLLELALGDDLEPNSLELTMMLEINSLVLGLGDGLELYPLELRPLELAMMLELNSLELELGDGLELYSLKPMIMLELKSLELAAILESTRLEEIASLDGSTDDETSFKDTEALGRMLETSIDENIISEL
jgi:hypothetical protein